MQCCQHVLWEQRYMHRCEHLHGALDLQARRCSDLRRQRDLRQHQHMHAADVQRHGADLHQWQHLQRVGQQHLRVFVQHLSEQRQQHLHEQQHLQRVGDRYVHR